MLQFMYVSLLTLGSVWSRDSLRTRGMPTISNSLVNLGKMDITFHIGKDIETSLKEPMIPTNSKPFPVIDECLCNSLKSDPVFGGASNMINKILMSNDLFNFNKDGLSLPQCCESHEENSITFEFGSKTVGNLPQSNSFQSLPIIFDNLVSKKLPFSQTPLKPKAIEIFLFPKNKISGVNNNKLWLSNYGPPPTKKNIKKDIKIVGDKDLNNSFDVKHRYDVNNNNDVKNVYDTKNSFDAKNYDNLKYETVPPVTNKKEIGIKEQDDDKSVEKEEVQKEITTISYPNAL